MKNMDGILDMLDHLLPSDAKKTVIYCEVEKNAYEVFYYSFLQMAVVSNVMSWKRKA